MAEGAVIPMAGRVACVFCDIVAGRVEASRVYEDDFPGHMLVIPRAHYASLSDLPEAVSVRRLTVGQEQVHSLAADPRPPDDPGQALGDGEAAGQEVFHCHLHVLPRFRGDSFRVGHGSPEGERS